MPKILGGMPVINAKRPAVLEILPRDVKNAERKEPGHCVVARACERQLHAVEARIHLGRIYVRTNESNWVRYMTPQAMRQEIVAFDRGGWFKPGVFNLAPPQPSKQTGKRQGTKKDTKTGKKRQPYHILTDVRSGPA